ncbi:MAG TPA: ABC transporter substrate-binding protein [Streptosporangiaceae bacterium]|nr:ABC transporter substrate-binding protein [Streptosporangiaceae bacterium]
MGSRKYPGRPPLSGKQLTAVIGVAGALALAGCGGSSGGSSAGGGGGATQSATGSATSGKIVWSASPIAGSGATDTRTVLINAFEKKYPNIHVTLTSAPTNTDTNRATLATEISGGSATPDVFMGDVIWPAQFAAHQLAVPLSDYLPKSYWDQFASGLVQGASYKGKVYGSPLFEDQGFMYYRKDLLSKAGLQPPTTWEQLESEAKTLVSKGLVKYGFVFQGASYEGLTCNFMEYLTSAGGSATNSDYSKATLDSPAAVKAVTFMRSLITSGATPAAVSTFQEPQAMSIFAAGNAGFLRNWDYAYSNATTPATGKLNASQVGVEPMPTFAGQPTPGYSNIGGWNMYINPHSKNIAVDLTFIKWLASDQAQTILATKYSEIPTTNSVRDSGQVKALNPVLAIISKTKLVPRPAGTPNYPALSTAIYTNVNAALAGSQSPSAAMSAAQSQASTALSTSGGGL